MKQLLFLLFTAALMSFSAAAQDFIHLRNKEVLKVKKAKEEGDVIYYREYDSKTLVKLYVPKSEVEYVEYSDGKIVDFSHYKPSAKDKKSIDFSDKKNGAARVMETPQFHSFVGILGGLSLPTGNYARKSVYDGFENSGFAKWGWYGEIQAGYYLTEVIAIQGKYGSLNNNTGYSTGILFFNIPISYFGVDEIKLGEWSHQYFLFGPKFSFPVLNSYLDLGVNLGSINSTEPEYEISYINGESYANIPGRENGLLYNFDFAVRIKLYKKLFLTYQMNYLNSQIDFIATHYIENGVKTRFQEKQEYTRKVSSFNMALGLNVLL